MDATPTTVKLAAENNTLRIDWSDGHVSHYPYPFLRNKCPCATCTDQGMAERPSAPAFPMFSKLLRPERAELVGRYALQLYWSDGHSTGIYTFEYLREICPCPACTNQAPPEEPQQKIH